MCAVDKERLDKLFDFFREIDKEKQVQRQTLLADASRRENDAEHAWHAAVMALVLSDYSNTEIDVLKTVSMLLVHDLVEIYAGDTPAYDEEAKKTQKLRETAAADKLFGMLPENDNHRLRTLWDEFEQADTPESLFAHAMDNIQPAMLNDAAGGLNWREWGTRLTQLLNRNSNTADGSQVLWDYTYENIIKPNIVSGNITDDTSGDEQ